MHYRHQLHNSGGMQAICFRAALRPTAAMVCQCTQDTDTGAGYLAYSSENNGFINFRAITDFYTHVTSTYTKIFVGMAREAPALFKHRGVFLIATSGCTGWEPNKLEVFWTRYATIHMISSLQVTHKVEASHGVLCKQMQ